MKELHQSNLLEKIAALRTDTKYSDLTFTCEGSDFHAHRAVVFTEAPDLARHMNHEFKEAQSGVICLAEFDSQTVGRMLDYVYTLDYRVDELVPQQALDAPQSDAVEFGSPECGANTPRSNQELLLHTRVHRIADYCHMPTLQALAVEKFKLSAATGWQTKGFVEVVEEVYKTTTSVHTEIRQALMDVMYDHIEALLADDTVLATVRKFGHPDGFELLADLVNKLSDKLAENNDYTMLERTGFEQKLAQVESELNAVKTTSSDRGSRLGDRERDVQTLERIITSIESCRDPHCRQNISFAVRRSREGKPTVSCRNCGRKYE